MERLHDILSSKQFDLGFYIGIYKDVELIKDLLKTREGRELLTHVLPGYVVGEIFWQESSRTFHSFASAGGRLGATVISERGFKKEILKDGKEISRWTLPFSSETKDAWLEDEIKAFASCYDLLILRTPPDIEIDYLKAVLRDGGYDTPLINAGDGPREHPSQTIIDTLSIFYGLGLNPEKDWSRLSNYSVAFINDGKNSRTIHSLIRNLGKLFRMRLVSITLPGSEMPRELLEELKFSGCDVEEVQELVPADVYYVTRHQSEYGTGDAGFEVDRKIADKYGVKIVLHPFPRSKKGGELPIALVNEPDTVIQSLDKDPRALYFYQMAISIPIRMAILKYILNPDLDLKKLKEEKLIRGIRSQCAGCKRVEYHELGWTEYPPQYGYIQALPHIFCPRCRPPSGFHL